MAAPTRTQVSDLRGAARLAIDATTGIADIVEQMHRTIQRVPRPLGRTEVGSTRGITGFHLTISEESNLACACVVLEK